MNINELGLLQLPQMYLLRISAFNIDLTEGSRNIFEVKRKIDEYLKTTNGTVELYHIVEKQPELVSFLIEVLKTTKIISGTVDNAIIYSPQVIPLLVKLGFKATEYDSFEGTICHALMNHKPELVPILLKAGARPYETTIAIAEQYEPKLVPMLKIARMTRIISESLAQ